MARPRERSKPTVAGFANPDVYEYLEAEGVKFVLLANRVLQERSGYLLKPSVGRPSNDLRRSHANFTCRARSWSKPRRVVDKVDWHAGELYPRVGFIVTNMARPAENFVAFYNQHGTCEQYGSKRAWARSNGRGFHAVRSPPMRCVSSFKRSPTTSGNSLRTPATPEPIKNWSMTSLRDKLIKIGAKVVEYARYVAFQMAEVAVPKTLFADILRLIAEFRPPPIMSTALSVRL
jgi:hypothetical protein